MTPKKHYPFGPFSTFKVRKKCYNCHFHHKETRFCWYWQKGFHHLSYCSHWLEEDEEYKPERALFRYGGGG